MEPWYKDGLRFGCTGCGGCCTGSPGYVWLEPGEAEKIAAHLGIPVDEFIKKYARQVGSDISLREDNITYDCVFLDKKRCTIYESRPQQCRAFPWWQENLKNKRAWEETKKRCEGIDHKDAPLVSLKTIKEHLPDA